VGAVTGGQSRSRSATPDLSGAGGAYRPDPGSDWHLLAGALLAGPWLPGRADVFAHGERESMKAVRAALKTRLGDDDQLSLSGYWASGRTEDVFQSEKRQPIGQI
jgi:NADPH-dependent ferric siderophore reductase